MGDKLLSLVKRRRYDAPGRSTSKEGTLLKYKKEEIPREMDTQDFVMHEAAMGGMNVGYEIYNKELDAAPFFKGLPDNRCQAEHWGYVLKGSFKVDYGDHQETLSQGDVYYLKPGHTPHVSPGTELLEFSPKAEYDKTMKVVAKNMATMKD
jgi:mannose-6-phosphate isomerase-like protein (cupin superfamily)